MQQAAHEFDLMTQISGQNADTLIAEAQRWRLKHERVERYATEMWETGGGYSVCRGLDMCLYGWAAFFYAGLWLKDKLMPMMNPDVYGGLSCLYIFAGMCLPVLAAALINTSSRRRKMRFPVIGAFTLLSELAIRIHVWHWYKPHPRLYSSQALRTCAMYITHDAMREYTDSHYRVTKMREDIAKTIQSLTEVVEALAAEAREDSPIGLLTRARKEEAERTIAALRAQDGELAALETSLDDTIAPVKSLLHQMDQLCAAKESLERIELAHAIREEADSTIQITRDSLYDLREKVNGTLPQLAALRNEVQSFENAQEEVKELQRA